ALGIFQIRPKNITKFRLMQGRGCDTIEVPETNAFLPIQEDNTMQLEDLFHFLQAGVTPFHAAAEAARLLDAAGYTRLEESAYWNLEAGRGYYVTRNNSAVIAWRIPAHAIGGWRITASHSDSPAWRIKNT